MVAPTVGRVCVCFDIHLRSLLLQSRLRLVQTYALHAAVLRVELLSECIESHLLHLAETDLLGDAAAHTAPLQRHLLVVHVHEVTLTLLLDHHDHLRRENVRYDEVFPCLLVDFLHVVDIVLLTRNDQLREVSARPEELTEDQLDLLHLINHRLLVDDRLFAFQLKTLYLVQRHGALVVLLDE